MKRIWKKVIPAILGSVILLSGTANAERYTGDGANVDFAIEHADGKALIYLADKTTNSPLSGVEVVLTPDDEAQSAIVFQATQEPGVYEAMIATKLPEGNLNVSGLVTDEIEVYEDKAGGGQAGHEDHGHGHGGAVKPAFAAIPAGVLFAAGGLFIVGLFLGRLSRKNSAGLGEGTVHIGDSATRAAESIKNVSAVLLSIAAGMMMIGGEDAVAGEGHSHAELTVSTRGGDEGIFISKKSQFLLGLRTEIAKKSEVEKSFQTIGHAAAAPNLDALVKAPVTGMFKPMFRKLGATVRKGDILGWIESVGRIPVLAPLSGSLVSIDVHQEMRVEAGEHLFRISDPKVLWVDAEIFQKDLVQVRTANKVVVNFDGRAPIVGSIVTYKTQISEQTLTGKVYVEIENADKMIAPGSVATISFIEAPVDQKAYILPRRAVLSRGGENVVFVQTGPEMFEQRTVISDPASTPDKIIVYSGLLDGDRVVVTSNYQLLTAAH